MSEIRVGQVVTLRRFRSNALYKCVAALVGRQVVVAYIDSDRRHFSFECDGDSFGWPVRAVDEAPDAAPRTIRLPLAKDTTETECGSCEHVGEHCAVFKRRVRVYDHEAGRERNQRLPECVAAEK